jgi:hypothetical protein
MEQKDALDMLAQLAVLNFKTLVITMPNGEFNHWYGLDPGAKRHDDHRCEPSQAEFREFISAVFGHEGQDWHYHYVGDQVITADSDESGSSIVSPTHGAVITK